jgi:hypothetical protein
MKLGITRVITTGIIFTTLFTGISSASPVTKDKRNDLHRGKARAVRKTEPKVEVLRRARNAGPDARIRMVRRCREARMRMASERKRMQLRRCCDRVRTRNRIMRQKRRIIRNRYRHTICV